MDDTFNLNYDPFNHNDDSFDFNFDQFIDPFEYGDQPLQGATEQQPSALLGAQNANAFGGPTPFPPTHPHMQGTAAPYFGHSDALVRDTAHGLNAPESGDWLDFGSLATVEGVDE